MLEELEDLCRNLHQRFPLDVSKKRTHVELMVELVEIDAVELDVGTDETDRVEVLSITVVLVVDTEDVVDVVWLVTVTVVEPDNGVPEVEFPGPVAKEVVLAEGS